MNVGFNGSPAFFLVDEDLIQLQKFASSVPYDLSSVSGYYTNSIKDLLADDRFLRPLGADADRICRAISRRIEERRFLDQTFFKPGLPTSLSSVVGAEIWERHSGTIGDFETSYYRNAIPATVGADVVFSHEHAKQRKILRNTGLEGASPVRIDLSREAKSLYESALSMLTTQKLARLRQSDEFAEFQNQLKKLQAIDAIDDPRLELAIQAIYVALDSYHRLIDDELRIQRSLACGTRLLDRWNLRGFLRNGAWLLRLGAEAVSRKPLRATAVSSLAAIVNPHLRDVALTYYAVGGRPAVENRLDKLSKKLADSERRYQSVSNKPDRISAQLNVSPRAFKDSIYGDSDMFNPSSKQ